MTTTTDIARRNGSLTAQHDAALAIRSGQTTWDEFQAAALNQLGLKEASNADRAVFLHQCQRTGLDPFARQIYMIPRKEWDAAAKAERVKWTIQTGIEGWRVIRDRAERREGVRGIPGRFVYYDYDDNERKVWTRPEPPAAVEFTYTVRDRNGVETPYTSILRFAEYVQTGKEGQPIALWKTKAVHMLEKCTEADAYRKAFPQDFSGIHLDDAMPPADPDAAVQPQRHRVPDEAIAARRQTVTATMVTPDPSPAEGSSPPAAAPAATPPAQAAGEAPAAEGERPVSPSSSGQRSQICNQFRRHGVDPDTEEGWAVVLIATGRLIGIAAIADLSELTDPEAARVIRELKAMDARTFARLAADENGEMAAAAGGEATGE